MISVLSVGTALKSARFDQAPPLVGPDPLLDRFCNQRGDIRVAVGVCDELLTLPPLTHLAGQVAAAGVAIVTGVGWAARYAATLFSRGWLEGPPTT